MGRETMRYVGNGTHVRASQQTKMGGNAAMVNTGSAVSVGIQFSDAQRLE